ncbi:oxygen-dependent coproporphyrinogen-III oxidase [Acrasis kona]|uniref:Oxygen-dependent coproporphyrinogen-III oxidase n=1 Tax=Acrasis kona TaxID=1008807 RepID=A0AAW2ZHG6_9EUKA
MDFGTHDIYTKPGRTDEVRSILESLEPGIYNNGDIQQLLGKMTHNLPTSSLNRRLQAIRRRLWYGKGASEYPVPLSNGDLELLHKINDESDQPHELKIKRDRPKKKRIVDHY